MDDNPDIEVDAPCFDCWVPATPDRHAIEDTQEKTSYPHAENNASDDPQGNMEPANGEDPAVKEDKGKFD